MTVISKSSGGIIDPSLRQKVFSAYKKADEQPTGGIKFEESLSKFMALQGGEENVAQRLEGLRTFAKDPQNTSVLRLLAVQDMDDMAQKMKPKADVSSLEKETKELRENIAESVNKRPKSFLKTLELFGSPSTHNQDPEFMSLQRFRAFNVVARESSFDPDVRFAAALRSTDESKMRFIQDASIPIAKRTELISLMRNDRYHQELLDRFNMRGESEFDGPRLDDDLRLQGPLELIKSWMGSSREKPLSAFMHAFEDNDVNPFSKQQAYELFAALDHGQHVANPDLKKIYEKISKTAEGMGLREIEGLEF